METSDQLLVDCCVCDDELDYDDTVDILGATYCQACGRSYITQQVKEATRNDVAFPLRDGKAVLDIEDFRELINDDALIKLYNDRGRDWAVPPPQRKFCRHNISRGNRPKDPYRPRNPPTWLNPGRFGDIRWLDIEPCEFQLRHRGNDLVCLSCHGTSCSTCAYPLFGSNTPHTCTIRAEDQNNGEIPGIDKGKDYQVCPNPNCQLAIYLSEACNHMTCVRPSCRTEFCYLCGKEATPADRHWGDRSWQCPLYNSAPESQGESPPPSPDDEFHVDVGEIARVLTLAERRVGVHFRNILDGMPDGSLEGAVRGWSPRIRDQDEGLDYIMLYILIHLAQAKGLVGSEEGSDMIAQFVDQGEPPMEVWQLDQSEVVAELAHFQLGNPLAAWEDPRRFEILLSHAFKMDLLSAAELEQFYAENQRRLLDDEDFPTPTPEEPLRAADRDPPTFVEED